MIIIDENAETKLMQALDQLRAEPEGQRCIYLQVAPSVVVDAAWREILIAQVRGTIEADTKVYLCRDQDVFILGRGISAKEARILSGKLADLPGSTAGSVTLQIFELVYGWNKVAFYVSEKLRVIQQQAAEVARQQAEMKLKLDYEATLAAPLATAAAGSIQKRRAKHTGLQVLMVEDDIFSARLVENVLRDTCGMTMVHEGKDALNTYVAKAPHVVFLDINLPDANGHELLQRIMEMDPDAYVVMLSGLGDKKNILRAVEAGAKGFIGKPFTREKLRQYLDKYPAPQPAGGSA